MSNTPAQNGARMTRLIRPRYLAAITLAIVAALVIVVTGETTGGHIAGAVAGGVNNSDNTTTPIKHVIVFLDENQTYDHYFGTYPYAANSDGTTFCPAAGTPGLPGASETVNSELAAGDMPSSILGAPITGGDCSAYAGVTPNPNAGASDTVSIARDPNASSSTTAPNDNEYQPQRLPPTDDVTCDNSHGLTQEEEAEDDGKMDDFVEYTSADCNSITVANTDPGFGMDYYDGNTITGLWNYAQNYAMSDNSWDAGFGSSFIGYVNSFGANTYSSTLGETLISNYDPVWDIDPQGWEASGENIGDLLDAKDVTWGVFDQGYDDLTATTRNLNGGNNLAYSPGYDPADYWQDTSNAAHTPPGSLSEIGFSGPANHNYDLTDFNDALNNVGGAALPAVSLVRAASSQSGHPSNSGPLDEQEFLTQEINEIEASPYWSTTAIIIEYDDSDGWYDHQSPTDDIYTASGAAAPDPAINNILYDASESSDDATVCSSSAAQAAAAANDAGTEVAAGMVDGEIAGEPERCGPSQRLPFLVISPYAKKNYVSHALTTQVSTLQFIEDNWDLGRMGLDTYDNLPQTDNLDDFFDWEHPQQNEVLLDQTCNLTGSGAPAVVLNTCNNTTANTATDGVTDAGFGSVQATPAAADAIPAAPTVSVQNSTIALPVKIGGTASTSTVVQASGATASAGNVTADVSDVDLSQPGTYTATLSATDDYTYDGQAEDIESMTPQTITVNVVPAINTTTATLTYSVSNPPTAAEIVSDSGASITAGTLDETGLSTELGNLDLSTPGTYTVQLTGSADGMQAIPVPITINVIPDPAITVANDTVSYQVGDIPSGTQVLADAGASINEGTLATPDLSGVNFQQTGSYTVTIKGSADDIAAAPQTLTVDVISAPAITVTRPVVSYLVDSDPSASQVLSDSGAQISGGSVSVDLSQVNFNEPGTYAATLGGTDHGISAQSLPLTVKVISQPVVSVGSAVIDTPVGSSLTAEQVLTDADAVVSEAGTPAVDLSGVNFNQPGDYGVSVSGSVDGLAAKPATLTIHVIGVPTVRVSDAELSYDQGARVDEADVLEATGAAITDGGDVSVDLSSVNFDRPGNYSVQIVGDAEGVAATPATVTITVRPVVRLKHAKLTYRAGRKPKAAAVLKSAGASISAGKLRSLSLDKVVFTEAGTYKVSVTGSDNGVSARSATLTIVVTPKLSVAHAVVRVPARSHLDAAVLLRKAGAKLVDGGQDKLAASYSGVNTRELGSYTAQIVAVGTNHGTAASVTVRVVVER